MKTMILKNVSVLLLATLTSASAFAAPSRVTLYSRYNGGDYVTAAYSFRYMSQDFQKTQNNWEILFEAREDFTDYFRVNTVTDDRSYIYDLGERNCADMRGSISMIARPLVINAAYVSRTATFGNVTDNVPVIEGHCYFSDNEDRDGQVQTLFHVASHIKSKSVVIDQIQLLGLTSTRP
jgi:hypothetical protein